MKIANFKDLMGGHESAEIVCIVKKEVMRKLSVAGDTVHIEAGFHKVDIPLNTPVHYEAWPLDRGNLLFWHEAGGNGKEIELKLCTEVDKVRYPDGTEDAVYPADSIAFMAKAYNGEGSYSRKDK